MDYNDAQIEIAILRSIERQADRTAAALKRVVELMHTADRLSKKAQPKKGKKNK